MSHIKEALDKILEKNLDGMRQSFSSALSEKAVQKLEEKKMQIAQNYFGLSEDHDEYHTMELDMKYGPKINGKRSNERTPEENAKIDDARNQVKKMMGNGSSSDSSSSKKKLVPVKSFNNSSGIDNF